MNVKNLCVIYIICINCSTGKTYYKYLAVKYLNGKSNRLLMHWRIQRGSLGKRAPLSVKLF